MKKLKVLIGGCGGDIGQSIAKIMNENELFLPPIGSDLHLNHSGIFLFAHCYVLPRCSDPDYLGSLRELIIAERVDLFVPVSEAEIRFFHTQENEVTDITRMLIANHRSLSVGLDKLATAAFLEESKLPFPQTSLIKDAAETKLPRIAKSRFGSGSKNIFLIQDQADFNYIKAKHPDFILQEYLSDANEEYTCGLFRSGKGEVRTIVFRRALMGGFSGFGEVICDPVIDQVLVKVAEKLELRGAINIQFRMTKTGPSIFEINPRFSSTVRFRDLLGFRDFIWSVQDHLGIPLDQYTAVAQGRRFYKGFSEYVNKINEK